MESIVSSSSYAFSIFPSKSSVITQKRPGCLYVSTNFRSPNGLITNFPLISLPKQSQRSRRRYSTVFVRASGSGSGSSPLGPLELESPVGKFLSEILISHPHLLPAAVDKQLEQLQTDRDAQKQIADPSATDLVLYKRIAEVKANDRRKALEEILYALVVQRFMDANVSLVANVAPDTSGRVDNWPIQEEKHEQLHSSEAFEMIENHLALILGNRLGETNSVAQISKVRVGQVYAASVMYVYFLKRVDQRFQLEKNMRLLPQGVDREENSVIGQAVADDFKQPIGSDEQPKSHPEVSSWSGNPGAGFALGMKASRLRNYVMSFDPESLQKYATIRSKEAVSLIEKHTEALFGRPDIVITPQGTIDSSKDNLSQ